MRTSIWYSLAAAALLAGCSNSSKGLSVSAASRGSAAAGPGVTTTAVDAGNGLTIERLRMVVREVELEGEPACATAPSGPTGPTGPTGPSDMARTAASPGRADEDGHDADDGFPDEGSGGDDDCTIRGGPFLVDLTGSALTGAVHWVATVDVPFGTYEETKFRINTVPASKAGSDAGLTAMADAHASILVEGTRSTTVDGTTTTAPFTFSTPMEVTQKHEGAIAVNEGSNVTLDVDPSGWFKTAGGAMLDPSDPTARGAIEANIRASIRVLKDDDGDDHEDGEHGEHGSGHP